MYVADNNKEVIQELFELTVDKKGECQLYECMSGKAPCLDQEELSLLEYLMDENIFLSLPGSIKIKVDASDNAVCQQRRQELPDSQMLFYNSVEERDVLSQSDIFESSVGEELLSVMPIILGVNSCYKINERNATVHVCLRNKHGIKIFNGMLLTILVALLECLANRDKVPNVKMVIEDFFNKIQRFYIADEELQSCIDTYVEGIRENFIENKFGSPICEKYIELFEYGAEQDVLGKKLEGTLEEEIQEFEMTEWLLYLVSRVSSEVQMGCQYPPRFVDIINRKCKEIDVPPMIQAFEGCVHGILQMHSWELREDKTKELIAIIKARGCIWDGEKIETLLEEIKSHQNS